jgi:radical SAM protein with 4Fe4S-binding SPASM domain
MKLTENELFEMQKQNIKKLSKDYLSERDQTKNLKQFDPFKFFFHKDQIMELLNTGWLPSPITLDIDPTNVCNQNCIWCSFDYLHRRKDSLSQEILGKLIIDLTEFKKTNGWGVGSIIFTGGGEPTLNPNLETFMRQCLNANIKCGLYTNGTHISESLADIMLNTCSFVRFSLEASNQKLYDALHNPNEKNAFEKVTKTINYLINKKQQLRSDITIGISFLVHPMNYLDIVNSVKRAKDLGVDYFQVKPVIKKAYEAQDINKQIVNEVKNKYEEIKSYANKNFDVIVVEQKLDDIVDSNYGRNYPLCLGHYFSSTITADGNVFICTEHRGIEKYKVGNLNDQGFYDIWNSIKRRKVINCINLDECQPGCKGHFRTLVLEHIKNIKHIDFI